jgi:hypothetical protein
MDAREGEAPRQALRARRSVSIHGGVGVIDRLLELKINRLRVLIAGAANIYWGEPVMTDKNFTMLLQPWIAAKPGSSTAQ